MWISHQVRSRTSPDAVGHASRIAEVGSVGDAERRAGLRDGDAGDLPATQQRVRKACTLEEWQAVYVADRQVVTKVEIGTGTVGREIIGVNESSVIPVRRTVDGMAVSVGDTQRQIAHRPPSRGLQRVIDGICLIFQARDVAKTKDGPIRVGIVTACHSQIKECGRVGDGRTALAHGMRTAVARIGHIAQRVLDFWRNGQARGDVGIVGGRHREQLIQVSLLRQMCSLVSYIGDCCHDVAWQFFLHVQVPLLHVGPNGFAGNGVDRQWEQYAAGADVTVAINVEL